tara:strand:- start:7129 stop:7791 length:663 start_codon:yes stop_codon:yes gene_type:complete
MSVTFPKTWAASEKLRAQDVRDNLDAMKDKQQRITSGDVQLASPWIQTHHIMQGRYDPIRNVSVNVSGVFGGRYNGGGTNNLSYCSRWITNRAVSTTNPPRAFITYTNITFDILRPCTLFFQWSMVHQSERSVVSGTPNTIVRTSLNDVMVAGTAVPHIVAEQPNVTHNVLVNGTQVTNGIILKDIPNQVLGYNIGLSAESTAGSCQNVSWAVSLECFYM